MTDEERERFQSEREQLGKTSSDLALKFDAAVAELKSLQDGLSEQTRRATARQLISWVQEFLRLVDRLVLVPARARLEAITVDSIELESCDAFDIALANRLDFMNGRAALVDRWRLIQVNADALQSVLSVTASGDIRTARNNAVSFRAPTGSLRMGLEFDAPFTRLLERNAYRESLIEYQRSRRGFIQSRDELHLGLRALLRQIEQLRQDLEIQRRAVTIAIRQVDVTLRNLNEPKRDPPPGEPPVINQNLSFDLLSGQTALRRTQNDLLRAWLDHYAARMRLFRELGVMVLDAEGRWIDAPVPESDQDAPPESVDPGFEELPAPPVIPVGWIDLADDLQPEESLAAEIQPGGESAAVRPNKLRRLPLAENTPGSTLRISEASGGSSIDSPAAPLGDVRLR